MLLWFAAARLRASAAGNAAAGAPWAFGVIAMTKLPHDALVFVGDGRKALFLRNAGDAHIPDLRTEQVFKEDNPPSREQGTDKPGRGFASAGSPRRGGMEETDWHDLEEHPLDQRVAAAL